MKEKVKLQIVKYVTFTAKYVLPAVLGWLEGDTHKIYDLIIGIIGLFG